MARKRAMPAALKRYWATHRRGKKRSNPRRRRRVVTTRRRNWISPGMVVAANPHRRRRRRGSIVRHSRRRRHSNPRIMGFAFPSIKSVAFAGLGFVGPSLITGVLTQVAPSLMTQASGFGIAGKYLVKIGSALGLHWAVRRFIGAQEAQMVLIGGGINVGLTLVQDFAPGLLPPNPMAMYVPTRRSLSSYVPVRSGMQGLALPAAPQQRIPSAAPFRSFSKFGTAQRYMRY